MSVKNFIGQWVNSLTEHTFIWTMQNDNDYDKIPVQIYGKITSIGCLNGVEGVTKNSKKPVLLGVEIFVRGRDEAPVLQECVNLSQKMSDLVNINLLDNNSLGLMDDEFQFLDSSEMETNQAVFEKYVTFTISSDSTNFFPVNPEAENISIIEEVTINT